VTPQEKLKEIKDLHIATTPYFHSQECAWLIARVEQLETALEYAYQNSVNHVADELYKNLYTGPKPDEK
jgi:hypothetical protein